MKNEHAYEKGAKDYYYGRLFDLKQFLTHEERSAYWNGYNDEPYGRKDYGYAEE
jgi:hypothetical protein